MCRIAFSPGEIELGIASLSDMKRKGRGFQFLVKYEGSNESVWIPGRKLADFFRLKNEPVEIE
jgi:hypothetical protein